MLRFATTVLLMALSGVGVQAAQAGTVTAETMKEARRMDHFDLRADRTGLDYRVFLVRPAEPPPPDGYPVIVLLDGNATVPMMETVIGPNPSEPYGSAVIVGIGYPTAEPFDILRRYRDLTPPTPPEFIPPSRDGSSVIETGGRDDFLAFLETQVIPAVEARLPIDRRRRTLFGHSLGGLFSLYVLYTRGDLFQTYIAADPAIWWSGQAILKEQAAFLDRAARDGVAPGTALLIETSGKLVERPLPPAEAERLKRLRSGQTGREVAATLAAVPGLRLAFHDFMEESHGSMLPLAVADALRFAFGRNPD
ncbi:ferri-bacillibactin esterase besA (plasmid) [Azospirillum sp. TSH58]|uniref:alpha/beta hydrolase n=1 Tax=Azospirillum sp. TSH58 TaxID=664962 RepID=UPI000D601F0C|nr:alpha/beta hydrolase-fold protein [Azospirillum sp. TSH58]AWJ82066.1 ferri-bacillibactin esterase besA [Azospirillum sp. TSH58]